jgi:hypothetical protein
MGNLIIMGIVIILLFAIPGISRMLKVLRCPGRKKA